MKTKILVLFLAVLAIMTMLTGCSSGTADFKAVVGKETETIATVTDNAEDELMKVTLPDGTPLFKSVTVDEGSGQIGRASCRERV